jgi:hypothetical protein
VIKTLEELRISPIELLVWRSEDDLFEALYLYYEKLSNADLASSIRSEAAESGGDLKTKLAVLAALDPEYNIGVAKERAKKGDKGINSEDLSTLSFTDGPNGSSVSVRDPIAAVASKVIEGVELDKVMDAEHRVNPNLPPKPMEEDDPIAILVRDSLETGKGEDFVKYFRVKD